MSGTLSFWLRRRRVQLRSLFAAKPSTVPGYWRGGPTSVNARRIVLFVTYAANAQITLNARHQVAAWQREGFDVITIVVVDDLAQTTNEVYPGDQVFVRRNVGYDFGAWASVIVALPDVDRATLVVVANDSVYGPTAGFQTMLQRVVQSTADVVSATDSYEQTYHIQSYLLFFKPRALRHPAFLKFWQAVRIGNRQQVIDLYETALARYFLRNGLTVKALFPTASTFRGNRTLTDWKGLLDAGFPFIKAQLVRDNPFKVDLHGWEDRMVTDGYDSAIAVADVTRRRLSGS